MNKIRIVTDSASDIPQGTYENVTILPLTVSFGEESYQDGITISHEEFFEKLISNPDLPTTSLVSPAAFEDAYRAAAEAGEDVIAILVSSKLSGTYQSAVLAAEDFDSVRVVDSRSATVGQYLLIRYALQLIEQGKTADQIVEALEEGKNHIKLYGLLDTLEFLKRGGRISKTVALLGGALGIKPIVALSDGEVIMAGKARGNVNGGKFLMDASMKDGIDYALPHALGYSGVTGEHLDAFIAQSASLWEESGVPPIYSVGAAIGTHVGPGGVVIAFFERNR